VLPSGIDSEVSLTWSRTVRIALAAAMVLAACGGGGSTAPKNCDAAMANVRARMGNPLATGSGTGVDGKSQWVEWSYPAVPPKAGSVIYRFEWGGSIQGCKVITS
jgi:hypothetical protein